MKSYTEIFEGKKAKAIFKEFTFYIQIGKVQNPYSYELKIKTHKKVELNAFIKKAEKELINKIIEG